MSYALRGQAAYDRSRAEPPEDAHAGLYAQLEQAASTLQAALRCIDRGHLAECMGHIEDVRGDLNGIETGTPVRHA